LLSGREIEYEEIKDYLCANIKFEFYSFNGETEIRANLKCELARHMDDYLRLHFHFGTETMPYYRSDDIPLDSYEAQSVTFTQNYHNE
jgi:hypothetical protein